MEPYEAVIGLRTLAQLKDRGAEECARFDEVPVRAGLGEKALRRDPDLSYDADAQPCFLRSFSDRGTFSRFTLLDATPG